MLYKLLLVIIATFFIYGCAGGTKELYMDDVAGNNPKTVVFPNGTIFGGASKDQASVLAQIFVDSHNMSMHELREIKITGKEAVKNQEAIKKSAQKLEESAQQLVEAGRMNNEIAQKSLQKNYETAQNALNMLEQLSKTQGTGEITVFFQAGSIRISRDSHEYERLIGFADYLSRESKGRKILFISIGRASAVGDKKLNQRLAKGRSEFPVEVIDKYLVNIPHEFYKVYGTGDIYSPKNVSMREHERYQHTRLVAVFAADQIPGQILSQMPGQTPGLSEDAAKK